MTPRARRIWRLLLTLVTAIALAALLASVVVFAFVHLDQTDRLTAETDVLGGAGFALALLAAVVAVAAYLTTDQTPDLAVELVYPLSPLNEPLPIVDAWRRKQDGARLSGSHDTVCKVLLHNRSRFSARSPAVRIQLMRLSGLRDGQPGWQALRKIWAPLSKPGVRDSTNIVQWDGGATYAIHGEWTRELPPLDFNEVVAGAPGISSAYYSEARESYFERWGALVEIVADGLPRQVRVIPIRVPTVSELESDLVARLGDRDVPPPTWHEDVKVMARQLRIINAGTEVVARLAERLWRDRRTGELHRRFGYIRFGYWPL